MKQKIEKNLFMIAIGAVRTTATCKSRYVYM